MSKSRFLLLLAVPLAVAAVQLACGGSDVSSAGDDAGTAPPDSGRAPPPPVDGSIPTPDSGPPGPFTISVTVSGLEPTIDAGADDAGGDAGDAGAARVLVLRNNGGDELKVPTNGTFAFTQTIAKGGAYAVLAAVQPGPLPSEACVVQSGTGTATADVTVDVTCSVNTYDLGGTVANLAVGADAGAVGDAGPLVLQNNAASDLNLTKDGAFKFPTQIASAKTYDVSVKSSPIRRACFVRSGGKGRIRESNVGDVNVDCMAKSCKEIHDLAPALPNGEYVVDPDGNGAAPPFLAYCDMTSAGGGWTLLTWTAKADGAANGTPNGVPYPGYAQCATHDCVRGTGVPIADLNALFGISASFAKGQSVAAATLKATFGPLASYEFAGSYDYGTLTGLVVNYGNPVACTGLVTGTYANIVNTVASNGAVVYLSQSLAYQNTQNFSVDVNGSTIWNVGVSTGYCNGNGSMPGSWMGTWATVQYGPGQAAVGGSSSVWIR